MVEYWGWVGEGRSCSVVWWYGYNVWITANIKMLPVLFQRWLLEKSACTPATAHSHTARKRLMFGLWRGKGLSPESSSSILMGLTPTSGWRSPRSYRSIMGYSCFSVEWVLILLPQSVVWCGTVLVEALFMDIYLTKILLVLISSFCFYRILKFSKSMYNFQVCFDHKPRIISKTNKDDPSLCSHPVTKHDFEDHK